MMNLTFMSYVSVSIVYSHSNTHTSSNHFKALSFISSIHPVQYCLYHVALEITFLVKCAYLKFRKRERERKRNLRIAAENGLSFFSKSKMCVVNNRGREEINATKKFVARQRHRAINMRDARRGEKKRGIFLRLLSVGGNLVKTIKKCFCFPLFLSAS
jgi:hypothetical protein